MDHFPFRIDPSMEINDFDRRFRFRRPQLNLRQFKIQLVAYLLL
jgi:hypothetical protein